MATITQLKTNHDSAIRQQTQPNSISPNTVANQLDNLANEVRDRGIVLALLTSELSTRDGSNTKLYSVAGKGLYEFKAGDSTPLSGDDVVAGSGGRWHRILKDASAATVDTSQFIQNQNTQAQNANFRISGTGRAGAFYSNLFGSSGIGNERVLICSQGGSETGGGGAIALNGVNVGAAPNTIQFFTNGSERVRISPSGNLLVNTTTENGYTNIALQVNGAAWCKYLMVSGFQYLSNTLQTGGGNTDNFGFAIIKATAADSTNILLSGTLGGGGFGGHPSIYFGDNLRAFASIQGMFSGAWWANEHAGDLVFKTTPNVATTTLQERVRITSNGNLIAHNKGQFGNATEVGLLEGNFPATLHAVHGSGNWGIVAVRAANDTGSANITLYKTRNENPSIPTACAANDVLGRITWMGVDSGGAIRKPSSIESGVVSVASGALYTYMDFFTSHAVRMRISDTGNLLVGTITDTGEKLQVNGDIKLSTFGKLKGGNNSIQLQYDGWGFNTIAFNVGNKTLTHQNVAGYYIMQLNTASTAFRIETHPNRNPIELHGSHTHVLNKLLIDTPSNYTDTGEKLQVNGSGYFSGGVIVPSPNGTKYKIEANDSGGLTVTAV